MSIKQVIDVFRDNIDEDSTTLWFHIKTPDNRSVYFHVDFEKQPAFSSLIPMMDLGPSRAERLRDEAAKLIKNMPGVLPDFSELPQIEDTSPAMQEVFSQLEASDSTMAFVDFEDHLWEDLNLTQEEFENQMDADIDKYCLSDVIEKNQGESLYVCYANLLTQFSMPAPEQVQERRMVDEKTIVSPSDKEILILDKNDRSRVIYEGPLPRDDAPITVALQAYRNQIAASLSLLDKLIQDRLLNENRFSSYLEFYKLGTIKTSYYRDLQAPEAAPVPCFIYDLSYDKLFKRDCFHVVLLDPSDLNKEIGRTAALPSNLIIEMGNQNEAGLAQDTRALNRHGLVSKNQLERLDYIIALNKERGNQSPKNNIEIFAKEFADYYGFTTKKMEDPKDVDIFTLRRASRNAAYRMMVQGISSKQIAATLYHYCPSAEFVTGTTREQMEAAMDATLHAYRWVNGQPEAKLAADMEREAGR